MHKAHINKVHTHTHPHTNVVHKVQKIHIYKVHTHKVHTKYTQNTQTKAHTHKISHSYIYKKRIQTHIHRHIQKNTKYTQSPYRHI